MDPLSVDFAALRTLRMVHSLGSFSRAAESLGTTQSTVSYSIDRLRKVFRDPLFVRQGGGIVATERCGEIVNATARMFDDYSALLEPRAFDPSNAEAEVTISCNYYERTVLLPGLSEILRRNAPGLRLNVLTSTVQGKAQLDRGETDLLIGPVRISEGNYYRRHLLSEKYVCIMSHDNPLTGVELDPETYLNAPHVTVAYGNNWQSRYLVEIEARGAALNSVMQVPSPAAVPMLLAGTDLISTVPRRLALNFGDAVHISDCPFPANFDVDLYWSERTHHSAMHRWLRSQIADRVSAKAAAL